MCGKRLRLSETAIVIYELKNPYKNGTTHVVFEPLDFIARLAALVPRPWVNLTRFHGVFAPNSKYRKAVTGYNAVHPSVALYTLECFLPQLKADFPGLDFNFIHGLSRAMTERVISWEADFGIIVNPIEHPDLVIRKLCIDQVTIFHTQQAQRQLIYDKNLVQSEYILKKMDKK